MPCFTSWRLTDEWASARRVVSVFAVSSAAHCDVTDLLCLFIIFSFLSIGNSRLWPTCPANHVLKLLHTPSEQMTRHSK